jgi:hypothetical protein
VLDSPGRYGFLSLQEVAQPSGDEDVDGRRQRQPKSEDPLWQGLSGRECNRMNQAHTEPLEEELEALQPDPMSQKLRSAWG